MMKQNVTGVDLVDHIAGLIHDLDGPVQAARPLALKRPAGSDGFLPRRLDIRQILAAGVTDEGLALADVEIIMGHRLGFAGYSGAVTREAGERSWNTLRQKNGNLRLWRPSRYKPLPLAPIV